MSIDLSDDVGSPLVSTDADLSEEFMEQPTIFETAVKTRIKELTKILDPQFEEN